MLWRHSRRSCWLAVDGQAVRRVAGPAAWLCLRGACRVWSVVDSLSTGSLGLAAVDCWVAACRRHVLRWRWWRRGRAGRLALR
jgi:hypothetical protein